MRLIEKEKGIKRRRERKKEDESEIMRLIENEKMR